MARRAAGRWWAALKVVAVRKVGGSRGAVQRQALTIREFPYDAGEGTGGD